MRWYQLEIEMLTGLNKGNRFIVGEPDRKLTHDQVIAFKNAHTELPSRIFHIVEVDKK